MVCAVILGAAAVFLWGLVGHPINHDVAWYLVATRRWIDGAELYVDLLEINPPLQFYLTLPAVWLADVTGFKPSTAQYCVVAGLMSGSLFWCWHLLARHGFRSSDVRIGFIAAMAAFLIILPMGEEGQREHVMTLFVLPLVLAWFVAPRPDFGRDAVLRAVFASLGLWIKPYFLIIPLALTVISVVRERSPRPIFSHANLTILVAGLLFVALVVLRYPAYLTEIAPVGAEVYGAYAASSVEFFWRSGPVSSLLFSVLCLFAWRAGLARVDVAFGLALAGMISYGAQFSGFSYHAIPRNIFIGLGVVWILTQRGPPRGVSMIALSVAVVLVMRPLHDGRYFNGSYLESYSLIAPLIEGSETRGVLVVSDALTAGLPLVPEAGGIWQSRYPSLWPVPGAVTRLAQTDCDALPSDCEKLQGIIESVRVHTLSDLQTRKPDLLIFDLAPKFVKEPGFDFLKFMQEMPEFAAELENYRLKMKSSHMAVFVRA